MSRAASLRVTPSLLSADFSRLAEQIRTVEQAGADGLHLDVMDGHYVPNLTFGAVVIEAVRGCTDLPLDAHLMISNPMEMASVYARAGADAIAVHPETVPHLHKTLTQLSALGVRVGLALNPLTPIAPLHDAITLADYAIVMSVNPGWSGQAYIRGSMDRVRRLRQLADRVHPGFGIVVDGGMNPSRVPAARAAGANTLVAGSAIFGAPDPADAVRAMRSA